MPDFIISQVARLDGFSPAYNQIFFENLRNIKADYTNKSRLTYVNYVPLSIHKAIRKPSTDANDIRECWRCLVKRLQHDLFFIKYFGMPYNSS